MEKLFAKAAQVLFAVLGKVEIMMEVAVYQLKENVAQLNEQIRIMKSNIEMNASDPGYKIESLRAEQAKVQELEERRNALQMSIDEKEKAAKAKLSGGGRTDAQMSKKEAAGMFYQTVLKGGNVSALPQMAFEQLGAVPPGNADQGNGSNLLPKNLSNELLTQPAISNPLRDYMKVTAIVGLEVAKLDFEIENDDFLDKDGATAKEMKQNSELIQFGKKKLMLKAKVSQSVLRSSPLHVEETVASGLESGQTAKELKCIFSESPKSGEEHMSFYSTQNKIKKVEGATLFEAITNSLADLEDFYKPRACVAMNHADYFKMLKELSNNSSTLFDVPPSKILGMPVIFTTHAKKPVVGDFKFLHLNFDGDPLYDSDKDVDTGNMKFVLTTWFDIQIKMKSAFRIAEVKPGIGG